MCVCVCVRLCKSLKYISKRRVGVGFGMCGRTLALFLFHFSTNLLRFGS